MTAVDKRTVGRNQEPVIVHLWSTDCGQHQLATIQTGEQHQYHSKEEGTVIVDTDTVIDPAEERAQNIIICLLVRE